jgi:hypothetical protein
MIDLALFIWSQSGYLVDTRENIFGHFDQNWVKKKRDRDSFLCIDSDQNKWSDCDNELNLKAQSERWENGNSRDLSAWYLNIEVTYQSSFKKNEIKMCCEASRDRSIPISEWKFGIQISVPHKEFFRHQMDQHEEPALSQNCRCESWRCKQWSYWQETKRNSTEQPTINEG